MSNLKLNMNQKIAIEHLNGPMMVLAGPGSGKTTVITYRVVNLIKNYKIPPQNILVITFTKSASIEMKKRFNTLFGNETAVTFSTFHSLFFRILRYHYNCSVSDIIMEDEKKELIKKIVWNQKIDIEDEEDFINNLILEFSIIKSDLLDINFYNPLSLGFEDFNNIYKLYENYKIQNNKLDFDDMLFKCFELLKSNKEVLEFWQRKYKYILIDEFQDINKVQYESIKLINESNQNLFIVGDDDQSIYKFRGARPEFLLSFPNDFKDSKKVILDINYRSSEQIIKVCNRIIIQNKNRYDKKIIGTNIISNKPVVMTSQDINSEAFTIANKIKSDLESNYNEIAVVYRNNIQARAFIDAFMNLNIPYQIKDESPIIYEHFIARDILAYLKLSLNYNDNDSFERIINKPTRYISKIIIANTKKKKGNLIDDILNSKEVKVWQKSRIEELLFYLSGIKKRTTYEAFKYIRQGVGYDNYLKEYAEYRKVNGTGLFEILDELQESSKPFDNINDYLEHVEKAIEEIKNNRQKAKNRKFENNNFEGVTLSTMHSIKGLEYNTVFISSVVEDVIPSEKSKTDSEIEEERRLLYVGMTRAKQNLFISLLKTRHEKKAKPSRFLKGIVYN